MEKLIAIAKRWNDLKTDEEKWKFILSHKKELEIRLDNDGTYPVFCEKIIPGLIDDWDDLPDLNDFEWWIGNAPGINTLLAVLGIGAEGV